MAFLPGINSALWAQCKKKGGGGGGTWHHFVSRGRSWQVLISTSHNPYESCMYEKVIFMHESENFAPNIFCDDFFVQAIFLENWAVHFFMHAILNHEHFGGQTFHFHAWHFHAWSLDASNISYGKTAYFYTKTSETITLTPIECYKLHTYSLQIVEKAMLKYSPMPAPTIL